MASFGETVLRCCHVLHQTHSAVLLNCQQAVFCRRMALSAAASRTASPAGPLPSLLTTLGSHTPRPLAMPLCVFQPILSAPALASAQSAACLSAHTTPIRCFASFKRTFKCSGVRPSEGTHTTSSHPDCTPSASPPAAALATAIAEAQSASGMTARPIPSAAGAPTSASAAGVAQVRHPDMSATTHASATSCTPAVGDASAAASSSSLLSSVAAAATAQVQDVDGISSTSSAVDMPDSQSKVTAVVPAEVEAKRKARALQPVDYTTLVAACKELNESWVPAKVEHVLLSDRNTLVLRLKTLLATTWLHVCWHPAVGRIVLGDAPVRGGIAELFAFGEQVNKALSGLVLLRAEMPASWERVVRLCFGIRPGEEPTISLYCEIMARYSNVIVAEQDGKILVCAAQVGDSMSSLRQVQVGRTYQLPPIPPGVPPDCCSSAQELADTITRAAQMVHANTRPAPPSVDSHLSANAAQVVHETNTRRANQSGRRHRGESDHSAAAARPLLFTAAAAMDGSSSGQCSDVDGGASVTAVPTANSTPVAVGAGVLAENYSSDNSSSSSSSSSSDGSSCVATSSAQQNAPSADPNVAHTAKGSGSIISGAVRAFQGVSPFLVEELGVLADVDVTASSAGASLQQWEALFAAWQSWLQRLRAGDFAPSADDANGRYSVLGTYPQQHESVHALLRQFYGSMQAAELHAQLHKKLTAAVRDALKKGRGRIQAFEKQISNSSQVDEVQKEADLITANMYRIKAGATEVSVEDWDTGNMVTLKLDSTVTAAETVAALYKRCRKLRRAIDAISPLLDAARLEVEYLEEVEASVAQLDVWKEAADTRALLEVQEELVTEGYAKMPTDAALVSKSAAKTKKAQKKSEGGAASAFRQYTTPNGLQVLVGRNNRQNDELSHKVAQPEDIWMHVRGMPGSHTIVRVPAGRTVQEADLQCAANLACFFSKGRNNLKLDVIVTKAGWLKKPKGAKPGQVYVPKELNNVVGRPEDSLAAKEENSTSTS